MLPEPGTMVGLTKAFTPALLKGVQLDAKDPLRFNFIVTPGDERLDQKGLEQEGMRFVRYFMAGITLPENTLWVNLSPHEQDRIIDDGFAKTEMGEALLSEDYILKQLVASLSYPDSDLGKKFWTRVYAEAEKRLGSTDIPVEAFNKVWIAPEKAVIVEKDQAAFVASTRLKVMLERDYVAEKSADNTYASDHVVTQDPVTPQRESSEIAAREVLIPILEKEVNEGASFATLRQIYNAMVLAAWYKKALKESILGKLYADQAKVAGIDKAAPGMKDEIYQKYLAAFKAGAYNMIKEETAPNGEVMPRKYVSGGLGMQGVGQKTDRITPAMMTAPQKAQFRDASAGATRLGVVLGKPSVSDRPASAMTVLEDFAKALKEETVKELRWDTLFAVQVALKSDETILNLGSEGLEKIGNPDALVAKIRQLAQKRDIGQIRVRYNRRGGDFRYNFNAKPQSAMIQSDGQLDEFVSLAQSFVLQGLFREPPSLIATLVFETDLESTLESVRVLASHVRVFPGTIIHHETGEILSREEAVAQVTDKSHAVLVSRRHDGKSSDAAGDRLMIFYPREESRTLFVESPVERKKRLQHVFLEMKSQWDRANTLSKSDRRADQVALHFAFSNASQRLDLLEAAGFPSASVIKRRMDKMTESSLQAIEESLWAALKAEIDALPEEAMADDEYAAGIPEDEGDGQIQSAMISAQELLQRDPALKVAGDAEKIRAWKSPHGVELEKILNGVIKEYDIRGYDGGDDQTFPTQIDPELWKWIGRALGSAPFTSERHGRTVSLQPGDFFMIAGDNGPSTGGLGVVMGKDGKPLPNVIDAVSNGFMDAGINVINLNVVGSGALYSTVADMMEELKKMPEDQFRAKLAQAGIQLTNEEYQNLKKVKGGAYVTRSHVEVGTNGIKPNIDGITLYGDMLQAMKPYIINGVYRERTADQRGKMIKMDEIRETALNVYERSIKGQFSDLKASLDEVARLAQVAGKPAPKVVVNLSGGSLAATKRANAEKYYPKLFQDVLGEHLKEVVRADGDSWNENGGLADPTRLDVEALGYLGSITKEQVEGLGLNWDDVAARLTNKDLKLAKKRNDTTVVMKRNPEEVIKTLGDGYVKLLPLLQEAAKTKANVTQYSKDNPDDIVINFDLDADRISVMQDGRLFLGDEMFYPIIEYQLTDGLDPYAKIHREEVPIYFDSRMKSEFAVKVRKHGGIAKIHPKGHSKVKATIDVTFKKLVDDWAGKTGQPATKEAFLAAHPGFKIVQAEYSTHMFMTDTRGNAFDDAVRFGLFWLQAFAKVQAFKQKPMTMAGYIQADKDDVNNPLPDSKQLKEQRTSVSYIAADGKAVPVSDEQKRALIYRMTDKVKAYFASRPEQFEHISDWQKYEGNKKPFTLVEVEGVYHLFINQPGLQGEIFWGWSNTSNKVAFGTQSPDEAVNKKLAAVATKFLVESRQEIAAETNLNWIKIEDLETKALSDLFGGLKAAEIEAAVTEGYADANAALDTLARESAMLQEDLTSVSVGGRTAQYVSWKAAVSMIRAQLLQKDFAFPLRLSSVDSPSTGGLGPFILKVIARQVKGLKYRAVRHIYGDVDIFYPSLELTFAEKAGSLVRGKAAQAEAVQVLKAAVEKQLDGLEQLIRRKVAGEFAMKSVVEGPEFVRIRREGWMTQYNVNLPGISSDGKPLLIEEKASEVSLLFVTHAIGESVGPFEKSGEIKRLALGVEGDALTIMQPRSVTVQDGALVIETKQGTRFVISEKGVVSARVEAAVPVGDVQGGIDLTRQYDLEIKRDQNGMPLPVHQQPIVNMKIDGFSAILINSAPIDLPAMAGVK